MFNGGGHGRKHGGQEEKSKNFGLALKRLIRELRGFWGWILIGYFKRAFEGSILYREESNYETTF